MGVETLVVVGASLAGLRAVEAARKAGFAGAITLIGAEPHLPYDRPPLSKAFLDVPSSAQPAVPFFRTEQALRDELGVNLVLGQPATALDTERREIAVGDRQVRYDAVVIATGSSPRMIRGTGLAGVHPLRTLDDALAVRAALDNGARTVVIGAGFIGSEVASAARKRGLDVTVVEEHQTRGQDASTLTGLTVQIDQLRRSLEALAAKVRRHEETIRRLERGRGKPE